MNTNHIAKQSASINAPAAKVWEALINPAMIKKYLFGTDVHTDWKVGSPIIYKGVWEGKEYLDKGTILDIVPGKLLLTSYWSSLSGLPDTPENYKNIMYKLVPEKQGTVLVITQDNNASENEKNHSEQNWKMVLAGLKELVESTK
jgi:uncharacterized protein YndB with AHSA1/START domain